MYSCFSTRAGRSAALILAVAVSTISCFSSPVEPVPPPPSTSIPVSVGLLNRPYGLAVLPGTAYVTQLDAATYTRVSLGVQPAVSGVLATGAIPTGIATTPDGQLVIVASQDGNVTIHDGSTGAVLSRSVCVARPSV